MADDQNTEENSNQSFKFFIICNHSVHQRLPLHLRLAAPHRGGEGRVVAIADEKHRRGELVPEPGELQ